MDRIDARILTELQRNGRLSWSKLAEQVHLSASACQRRVEALVDYGVIEKFTVALNERALGNTVKAFVAVNIDRQFPDMAQDFREKIKEHPQVQACFMISGGIDFMLEVVAKDLAAFAEFIDGELLAMPAVKDASSSIVLRVVKGKKTMIRS